MVIKKINYGEIFNKKFKTKMKDNFNNIHFKLLNTGFQNRH